mmetsp:Transcript_109180/g.282197  ORF Transcript_109180/g.282197 Transcript_109180/m.282197 type:complete len:262 (-) Transcript_109180:2702-3487(-)
MEAPHGRGPARPPLRRGPPRARARRPLGAGPLGDHLQQHPHPLVHLLVLLRVPLLDRPVARADRHLRLRADLRRPGGGEPLETQSGELVHRARGAPRGHLPRSVLPLVGSGQEGRQVVPVDGGASALEGHPIPLLVLRHGDQVLARLDNLRGRLECFGEHGVHQHRQRGPGGDSRPLAEFELVREHVHLADPLAHRVVALHQRHGDVVPGRLHVPRRGHRLRAAQLLLLPVHPRGCAAEDPEAHVEVRVPVHEDAARRGDL